MLKILKYGSYLAPSFAAEKALDLFLTPTRIPRPFSETEWHRSAKKYKVLGQYSAFEWGPSEGPVVLLIHGWQGRGTQMGAFAMPLVQSGYRVVALDGPAHGDSPGKQTNAGEFSRFLLAAQTELGDLKAVVAHSFGAGCSVYATKLGLKVEKLVLVAGPNSYEEVTQYFLNVLSLSQKARSQFATKLIARAKVSFDDLKTANNGVNLNSKILIVHDEDDKEVSYQCAIELKTAWPKAQLLATKGLGHRRILKDKQVIEQVVKFIENA